MSFAIKIENLGKSYLIRHQQQDRYLALRDVIMRKLRGAANRLANPRESWHHHPGLEEFWALQDINLEIQQGDRIGIIGRNGAGKSTLLKILSRITEPTTGQVRIRGRSASLLEVGTGFHPELTGRENIYLNGAILGMRREEIRRKFDAIVEFSEVEKFLDTPVKRFSSGMYVRLAFAVAANLDSEILIVDEVFAVGDQQFQNKCRGKMDEVGKQGRTILFVSHNMGLIQQLTDRTALLANGKLTRFGDTPDVVANYFGEITAQSISTELKTRSDNLSISRIAFCHEKLAPGFNKPIYLSIAFSCRQSMRQVTIGLGIWNTIGARLLTSRHTIEELYAGENTIEFVLRDHHLPPGNYSLSLGVSAAREMLFFNENVVFFELSDLGVTEPGLVPYLKNRRDKIGTFIPAEVTIACDRS